MSCGTIAALALSAAGTGASEYAAVDEKNQMNQATANSIAQQKQFQNKASNVFNQSLSQSTPQAAQSQIQAGTQQTLNATKAAALPGITLPQLGDPTTASQNNVSQNRQNATNQLGQQANANLQGYSNYGFQQGLKDLSANSNLGLISNQARSAESVLPYELQQAQNADAGLSSLGSLLGTAGSLAGLYGATKAPATVTPLSQIGQYPMAAGMLSNVGAFNYLTNPQASMYLNPQSLY